MPTPPTRQLPFIFVTGGCRSGKSDFAQRAAEQLGPSRLFLASAAPCDDEMRERIRLHQSARGPGWRVHEIPPGGGGDIWKRLPALTIPGEPLLFDCLTLWAAGLMQGERAPDNFGDSCDRLLDALWRLPCPVIVVGNEIGMGVVPASASGRAFRDMAGLAGQKIAHKAQSVIMLVSGIPLALKGSLPSLP